MAAETKSIQEKIAAEQRSAEQVIAAEAKLEVAARELKAAKADAEAKLTEAEGERKVVEARTKAEADVLKQEVAAYGSEGDYVRAKLYEKTAPKLRDVVTGDVPGEIFGLPVRGKTASVQQQVGVQLQGGGQPQGKQQGKGGAK